MEERAARREVVRVCRRLWERGLIAGPDGNVSVRLAADRVLVTPGGCGKAELAEGDLVVVSLAGERLEGARPASTELAVHLHLYRRRPDIGAVVHAHPPTATGFAVAGEGFERPVLPELVAQMGPVPLVPYETPGTEALAVGFEPWVGEHDAFLMANHGAVTVGPSLSVAHQRMESLEHAARILLAARLLGRVNELSPAQAAPLLELRARARDAGRRPGQSGAVRPTE